LPAFFVDCEGSEDDGAARLAGVGVFSPVASMPGSPVTSRRNILEKDSSEDAESGSGSEESGSSAAAVRGRTSVLLRDAGRGPRGQAEAEAEEEGQGGQDGHGDGRGREHSASDGGSGTNDGGSTSGESSFAMLDREESFEDAGVHIRRRVPGTTNDDE
jgi:hypothetical protein